MAIQIVRNGYMPMLEAGSWKPAGPRAPGRISRPTPDGEASQSAQLVALLRAIIMAEQENASRSMRDLTVADETATSK
jgi:hypothetical protein